MKQSQSKKDESIMNDYVEFKSYARLQSEYKKLQEMLLNAQKYADSLEKENIKLKDEFIKNTIELLYKGVFMYQVMELAKEYQENESKVKGQIEEILKKLNRKDKL